MNDWFETLKTVLENAYLSHEEPWITLRKPVADCIDKPGTFLDIGCANGYLLKCCLKWAGERGIEIEPYGLDISEKLIGLAKKRLPGYRANFFIGNAFEWLPPRRFDFVRTELVYVPDEYEKRYIQFLMENHLEPGGKLLVANYTEGMTEEKIVKGIPEGSHVTSRILERLRELGFMTDEYKDGFDTVKNRQVRIAVLKRT